MTRDQLVRDALALLEAEGFEGLTMRRLAERMGIKAASLYNHVRDKREILSLMADAMCEGVAAPDASKPWRRRLEDIALSLRRVLQAHRDGARVLAATPPLGPNRLGLVDQVLHALKAAGFSAGETADASHVLNSYVVGFTLDESLGDESPKTTAAHARDEARRWLKSLPRQRYPTLVKLADALVDAPADRRFAFGLRALLDGFERRLAPRR